MRNKIAVTQTGNGYSGTPEGTRKLSPLSFFGLTSYFQGQYPSFKGYLPPIYGPLYLLAFQKRAFWGGTCSKSQKTKSPDFKWFPQV